MDVPHYTIILEPDEDEWLACIPALPACYAPGDTPEEALRELQVVYEMILEEFMEEGKPLPPDIAVTVGAASA